jgi:hypothetical protein
MTERILSLAKIALTIIGTVATVFSCLIAFIVLANPTAAQRFIIEFYNPTTPTPQVVVITQAAPTLPPLPTYTPYPTNMPLQTNMPIPTVTATTFVPPANGILFQDNFENGLGLWNKYTGSWVITNGKLSKLTENPYSSLYEWIGIEQPAWKNYIVSLSIEELKSNSYPPIAIVVRQNIAEAKYIGAELDFWPWIYLSVISNDYSESTPIAGKNKNFTFPTGTEVLVEIEAKDDNYTLRVNGQQLQSVSIQGYDSPEIRIGLHCADYPGCPTFDNFKVTYLP